MSVLGRAAIVLLLGMVGCRIERRPLAELRENLSRAGQDTHALRKHGAELFVEIGCLGCHRLKGTNAFVGIDLTGVATRDLNLDGVVDSRDADWMRAHFISPRKITDRSYMPDYHLSRRDAEALMLLLADFDDGAPEDLRRAVAVDARLRGAERGQRLFRSFGCAGCHGRQGSGGVDNPNHPAERIPALQIVERMMVFSKDDATTVASLIEKGVDPVSLADRPPFQHYDAFVSQLKDVRHTIEYGKISERRDPSDPMPPLAMPAWGKRLSREDVDALIAYLFTIYRWEDDDE